MRDTGIEVIGKAPWGTHFCQFYDDAQDLADILVPYFAAGLAQNEFCMWVTSEPLRAEQAKSALAAAIGDIEPYLRSGQLEILDYTEWYTADGGFDADRVLQGWVDKLAAAQARGFDGLRLTGNTFWLEQSHWRDFTDYEAAVDSVIGHYQMMAICTYSLTKCGAPELLDVMANHAFALIKRHGSWQTIESAERRRAEEARRESDERYRALFQNMTEGFALHEIICDDAGEPVDYRFLEINPAFERLTSLKREDILGRTVREVIPGIEPEWISAYGKVALTGELVRLERFAAPLARHYEAYAFSPRTGQFAVIFSDITARKQAELALRQSEQRWATTLASIGDAVIATDASGAITFMNAVAEQLTGWRLVDAHGRPVDEVFRIINEHTRTQVMSPVDRVLQDGVVVGLANHTLLVRKDGAETSIDDSGAPIWGPDGAAIGVVLVFRDITARRQAEAERERVLAAAAQQARLLDTIVANTETHLAYLDPQLRFVWINAAYEQGCGHSRQELIGRDHFEFFPSAENEAIFRRVRDTGEPVEFHEKPFEYADQPQRGITYWDWTLTPVKSDQGELEGLVFSLTDVTEQVRQRQRLVSAERARAELAESLNREISHRTKNNLAMIAGLLQMQMAETRNPAVSAALRDTTGRIMAFAGLHEELQIAGGEDVDLVSVIQRVADATTSVFAFQNVSVSVTGDAALCPRRSATTAAVLANELITNAIKHGGPGPDGEFRVEVTVRQSEGALVLSVWNSGIPVSPDFDPTAQRGLGLRLIHDVAVLQHAGAFGIRPVGSGTLAEITLHQAALDGATS